MSTWHNVNDNGNFSKKNINDNVNVDGKYRREREVDRLADKLLEAFNLDDKSRGFMCKVAKKLSESRIWQNVETAKSKGKNPVGLFIHLCKTDGV